VAYQIAVDKEKQWNAYSMGPRWNAMGSATSSTINVGTLGVDVFDQSDKQLIWRGMGTKTVDPSGNPQKNMARLQKAVDKIMKNFPPVSKK
jgi:hypothetical protein